jgi:predicted amidohydrolase YtcJ
VIGLEKADLVLHGGIVLGHPDSDTVVVGGDRIIAHGRFDELKSRVGQKTRMVRLAGRTVAPGFIDCHLHFMEGAAVATGTDLTRCRRIEELLADLRVASGRTPFGNWLRAFGCDEALMRERRGPTRDELDRAVNRNPLRLRHQTLHASWLNSRAIAQLGLERDGFMPPEGSWIERDESGRLTGLVAGMEQWLSRMLPFVTSAELEGRVKNFSRELAASGVTAFTDATARNGPEDIGTFARLLASHAIGQRVSVMVGYRGIEALRAAQTAAIKGGVRLAGVKFTAITHWDSEALEHDTGDAFTQGFGCAFHATEVEELEAALKAIAGGRARAGEGPVPPPIARIEHGGVIPPDYPERIARMGAWVVTNPGFIHYRGAKYEAEPGLIPYTYRARSLLAAGVRLAAATDAPVTPARPLPAIAAAITRTSKEGAVLAPQERLTTEQAFALFTRDAAEVSQLAAGAIEEGRLADLIVLPADPARLDPAALRTLAVDLTIVGGRTIYERGLAAGIHRADAGRGR